MELGTLLTIIATLPPSLVINTILFILQMDAYAVNCRINKNGIV